MVLSLGTDDVRVGTTLQLGLPAKLFVVLQGTKLACGEGGCGACAVEEHCFDPATGTLCTATFGKMKIEAAALERSY